MDCCLWKDSSLAHIFVQHMEKLLCNVRISHLCMGLMMMKCGGRAVKLWCPYHLFCINLYCIYCYPMVLCTDYILVLTVASFSLCTHLAVCRWLYYLHFLCCYCCLLHSVGFPCSTHRLLVYMFFIILLYLVHLLVMLLWI